jgi:hypothetical protein
MEGNLMALHPRPPVGAGDPGTEAAHLREALAALEGRDDPDSERLRAMYRQRLRYLSESATRKRVMENAPLTEYLRARQRGDESGEEG